MAIFFSKGYVVNDKPTVPTVCLKAVAVAEVTLTAVWPKCSGSE